MGLRVTLEALKVWNNPELGKQFVHTPGNSTCNSFVDHVLTKAGLNTPTRVNWNPLEGRLLPSLGPQGAGEWHEKTHPFIMGDRVTHAPAMFTPVDQKNFVTQPPTMGGVVSYKQHVAIHAGDHLQIGSTQTTPHGYDQGNPISLIHTSPTASFKIFNVTPSKP